MMRKSIRSQQKTDPALPENTSASDEVHELERAKIQSLQSLEQAFKKSLDFMPATFFVFVLIVSFFAWWSSFQ